MNQRTALLTGVLFAGLAVAIGAFGAHALRPLLEQHSRTETFELAVRYQFYHAFAILFSGLLMYQFPSSHINRAIYCFAGGILLFSGSLYILSLTGIRVLGAVTPFGGVLFIAGWLLLLLGINAKRPG
ncbi:MAG TPA: DUF423 domain-containing protein [Chryseosolibacter sp.]|nr:DUF423 domain-containing protein [Chryseosolibacter sp.]